MSFLSMHVVWLKMSTDATKIGRYARGSYLNAKHASQFNGIIRILNPLHGVNIIADRNANILLQSAFDELCLKVSDQIELTKLIGVISTNLAMKFLAIKIFIL